MGIFNYRNMSLEAAQSWVVLGTFFFLALAFTTLWIISGRRLSRHLNHTLFYALSLAIVPATILLASFLASMTLIKAVETWEVLSVFSVAYILSSLTVVLIWKRHARRDREDWAKHPLNPMNQGGNNSTS